MTGQEGREEVGRWMFPVFGAVAVVLVLVILILSPLGAPLWFVFTGSETSVVVRNHSNTTLEAVSLVLDYDGAGAAVNVWEELKSGEGRSARPKKKDLWVTLSYVLDGEGYTHEEGVDLWTGETYTFEVQPDGSLRSGYDYGKGIGD